MLPSCPNQIHPLLILTRFPPSSRSPRAGAAFLPAANLQGGGALLQSLIHPFLSLSPPSAPLSCLKHVGVEETPWLPRRKSREMAVGAPWMRRCARQELGTRTTLEAGRTMLALPHALHFERRGREAGSPHRRSARMAACRQAPRPCRRHSARPASPARPRPRLPSPHAAARACLRAAELRVPAAAATRSRLRARRAPRRRQLPPPRRCHRSVRSSSSLSVPLLLRWVRRGCRGGQDQSWDAEDCSSSTPWPRRWVRLG